MVLGLQWSVYSKYTILKSRRYNAMEGQYKELESEDILDIDDVQQEIVGR